MPQRERSAVMWREGSTWRGHLDVPGARILTGRSRSACLDRIRREAGSAGIAVEIVPELVGVAEAAAILGWDKRRVFTYISRGSFPEPVAMLASGRVWRKRDVEKYARARSRRT